MLRQAVGLPKEEAEAAVDFDYGRFTPLTPEESVSQMIATTAGLTLDRSGEFIRYDGGAMSW